MIILLGYDNKTKQYKLFNTDVELKVAIKYCPFNMEDLLFGIVGKRTAEQERLVEQRNWLLHNSSSYACERKILYYSCVYDRKEHVALKIKAHLATGEVIALDQLNVVDYPLEKQQIKEVLGRVQTDGSLRMNSLYLNGTEEILYFDSISPAKVSNVAVVPLYARNLKVIIEVSFHVDSSFSASLVVPSIIQSTGKTLTNIYTPIKLYPDGKIGYRVSQRRVDSDGQVVKSTCIPKLSAMVVQTKIAFADLVEDWQNCVMSSTKELLHARPVEYSGYEQLEYLYNRMPKLRDKLELQTGTLDIGKLIEESKQFNSYLTTNQFYTDSAVLITRNGALKAVVCEDKTGITIDLVGITEIDDYVLTGFRGIKFICTGEVKLSYYGLQPNTVNYSGTPYSLGTKVEALEIKRRKGQ